MGQDKGREICVELKGAQFMCSQDSGLDQSELAPVTNLYLSIFTKLIITQFPCSVCTSTNPLWSSSMWGSPKSDFECLRKNFHLFFWALLANHPLEANIILFVVESNHHNCKLLFWNIWVIQKKMIKSIIHSKLIKFKLRPILLFFI